MEGPQFNRQYHMTLIDGPNTSGSHLRKKKNCHSMSAGVAAVWKYLWGCWCLWRLVQIVRRGLFGLAFDFGHTCQCPWGNSWFGTRESLLAGSGDHRGCWGLNLSLQLTRQAPDLLYCCSSPIIGSLNSFPVDFSVELLEYVCGLTGWWLQYKLYLDTE